VAVWEEVTDAMAVWVPPLSVEATCQRSFVPVMGLVYFIAEPESTQTAVPPELPLVGVAVAVLPNWVKLTTLVTVGELESETV